MLGVPLPRGEGESASPSGRCCEGGLGALLLLGLVLLLAQPDGAMAGGGQGPAQPLPAGRYVRQAAVVVGQGFDVRDLHDTPAGPALFGTLFREYGGVEGLGEPISRAFLGRDGCAYQVFQRAALQACPGQGTRLANTFELLTAAGMDPWLLVVHDIPAPREGAATTFDDAIAERIAWLRDPAIRAVYFRPPEGVSGPWSVLDAINYYGLPTIAAAPSWPVYRAAVSAPDLATLAGGPSGGAVSGRDDRAGARRCFAARDRADRWPHRAAARPRTVGRRATAGGGQLSADAGRAVAASADCRPHARTGGAADAAGC